MPKIMTYPDGEQVTFGYNARALLTSVTGTNAYVSGTTYDPAGRVSTRTLGNGLTQTFGYYNWDEKVNNVGQGGRLKTLTTGTLQNLAYQYDSVGNIKQIVNSIASETNTYEYDALYRLTNWTLNGTTETYQYDSSTGNLLSKAGVGLNYPTNGSLPHAATSATIGGNTNTYDYDLNGNQTHRLVHSIVNGQMVTQEFNLGYDAENRVVSVAGIKGTTYSATFTYRCNGKSRVQGG
jgi:YD repeat-containing protein